MATPSQQSQHSHSSIGRCLCTALAVTLALAGLAVAQSATPAPAPTAGIDRPAPTIRPPGSHSRREVPVFWFLGQSNCAGAETGYWLSNPNTPGNPSPQLAYQPDVKIWWPAASPRRPSSRPGWESYRTGDFGPHNNANWHLTELNFGPEASFGEAATRALGEPVYLFKFVAVAALHPDATSTFSKLPDRESLFDEILREWRQAAAALEAQDLVPQIRGIGWIQGEYDFIENFGLSYAQNLTRFIGDLRAAIARLHPDNRPVRFVIAEMHDRHVPVTGFDPVEALLRNAQVQVASSVEDVFLTDVDDLSLQLSSPFYVHFDGPGALTLGRRMFTQTGDTRFGTIAAN